MVIVSSGMYSHAGHVREDNQDSAGRFPDGEPGPIPGEGRLFAVADGMGGHRGGREASALAIRILGEKFFEDPSADIPGRLQRCFEEANQAIRRHGQANPDLQGMGTTLTALVFSSDKVLTGHVGDSRAYWIRNDTITQLTEDHSIVAEWLRKGWLTEEQAQNHPERSLLYRALGVTTDLSVDLVGEVAPLPGDRFLLCTDGLTNHVSDDEIVNIAKAEDPQKACEMLVDLALERGGFDNITVQAIALGEG